MQTLCWLCLYSPQTASTAVNFVEKHIFSGPDYLSDVFTSSATNSSSENTQEESVKNNIWRHTNVILRELLLSQAFIYSQTKNESDRLAVHALVEGLCQKIVLPTLAPYFQS